MTCLYRNVALPELQRRGGYLWLLLKTMWWNVISLFSRPHPVSPPNLAWPCSHDVITRYRRHPFLGLKRKIVWRKDVFLSCFVFEASVELCALYAWRFTEALTKKNVSTCDTAAAIVAVWWGCWATPVEFITSSYRYFPVCSGRSKTHFDWRGDDKANCSSDLLHALTVRLLRWLWL